jgi:anti-sigma-K factor RskA
MNGHPIHEEDFDLYALGALEGEAKRAIESHVAACPDCARKFSEAQGRIALLALAAPPVVPSPGVKERLFRQLHATAEGPAPSHAPAEPRRAGGPFGRWWAAVLVPAATVLALAAIFLWIENVRLDRQLASLRDELQTQQKLLTESREIVDMLQSRDTVSVALAPMPGMPKGAAKVLYNAHMGMLVYDGHLEPAPPDKSYQLWLVPMEGNPISAGVFNPTSGQPSMWMATVPPGVAAKMFAVTLEPAGGMPHPTGPKVLVGAVS